MIDQNILQDTVNKKEQLFSTSWLNLLNKEICFFCCFLMIFLYPCVRFSGIWVQVRGLCLLSQPADTLYFFYIFSLSAQCVHHFAPISSNVGSGPTKLTLVIS